METGAGGGSHSTVTCRVNEGDEKANNKLHTGKRDKSCPAPSFHL